VDELEQLIAQGRRPPTRKDPFSDELGEQQLSDRFVENLSRVSHNIGNLPPRRHPCKATEQAPR
jgi:hypothetical protein